MCKYIYRVDANECSSTMVLCTAALLDHLLPTVHNSSSHNHSSDTSNYSNSSSNRNSSSDSSSESRCEEQRRYTADSPYAIYPHTSNSNSSSSDSCSESRCEEQRRYVTDSPYTIFPHISGGMYDLWSLSERLRPERFPSSDVDNIIRHLADQHLSNHYSTQNDTEHNTTTTNTTTNTTLDARSHLQNDGMMNIRRTLALHLGDFQEIFSRQHHENQYDGVVTCFFLDTADHILEYVLIIKHVLRSGGVWINAGPLHYHRPLAIPYSHEQIIALVADLGFTVVDSAEVEAMYATEKYVNMKPDFYHVPITVFRLTKGLTVSTESDVSVGDVDAGVDDGADSVGNGLHSGSSSDEVISNWRGVNFVLN